MHLSFSYLAYSMKQKTEKKTRTTVDPLRTINTYLSGYLTLKNTTLSRCLTSYKAFMLPSKPDLISGQHEGFMNMQCWLN